MVFYVDDGAEIYVDGTLLTSVGGYTNYHTFNVSDNSGLIAIKAWNNGGGKGLKFYLADGRYSSGEVKCTNTEHSGTVLSSSIFKMWPIKSIC